MPSSPQFPPATALPPSLPCPPPSPPDHGEGDAGPLPFAALLFGKPTEVVGRLVAGDPLSLRARVTRRLAGRAYFLDADRLALQLAALCALRASRWQGEPDLEDWLEDCTDEVVALAMEEGRAASDGEPVEHPVGPPWTVFAPPLAIDGEGLQRACARFNRLPFATREAFFALVLEGATPDALARDRGVSLTEVARRARLALEVLRTALDVPPPAPRSEVRP